MHEAAELDEWVPQRARIEDEQRELKQRGFHGTERSDVPVAFVRRARAVL
jgi:hypothetical protein